MTDKNKQPLQGVVNFAKTFSSTGAAFILASLGVVTQTFHNGFLAFELSSFDNFWLRLFQAVLAAFFVSGALLFFTVRAANGGDKSVKQLVWLFFIFEVFCNILYWANKYIISVWGTDDVLYSSMIIAIPFSVMIPFSIKAYANELNFSTTSNEVDNEVGAEVEAKISDFNERLDGFDTELSETKESALEALKIANESFTNGDDVNIQFKTNEGEEKTLNAKIVK